MNELMNTEEIKALDETQSGMILKKFNIFFEQAKEWEEKARNIVITDENQVELMKEARVARLALKDIRCDAEKTRKESKEDYLRVGKAIDGVANIIKALIIPIEEHLEKQEKFVENLQEEKKQKIAEERMIQLSQYTEDVYIHNLKEMSEAGFQMLLGSSKVLFEKIQEDKQKVEAERIAKEKAEAEEREKMRLENEKLKKEAEEREKQIEEERKKAEEENKRLAEIAKKEAEERKRLEDEKAKKEEEERKRLEDEKAKKEEEEKLRLQKIEDDKKKAAQAPDKEKILAYCESIAALRVPLCTSKELQDIVEICETKLRLACQELYKKVTE